MTTVLNVNRRKIVLTSVYFSHNRYTDHQVEKMCKCIESYNKCRENTTIIAGDFNDQLGPAIGAERMSVGKYTLNESNKRGDRVKHGLVI